MSEECVCFCGGYIIESDEYAKLGYFELTGVKQYDLWYRNQSTMAVVNATASWTGFLSALSGLLSSGVISQNQYDCLLIQYHYIDGDDTTKRLIRRLSDAYDRTDVSNIHKILYLPGEQIGEEQLMLLQTVNSHFIDCAYGNSLDAIASLLGLSRNTSETDEQFRARILAKIPGFIGGGTIPAIKKAVSTFLGIDESYIYVEDGYLDAGAYGHFRVSIDISVAPGIGQTYSSIVSLINTIKAAGVMLDSAGFRISEVAPSSESISFSVSTNFVPETQGSSENSTSNMFYHRTDITYSDSLNVVEEEERT